MVTRRAAGRQSLRRRGAGNPANRQRRQARVRPDDDSWRDDVRRDETGRRESHVYARDVRGATPHAVVDGRFLGFRYEQRVVWQNTIGPGTGGLPTSIEHGTTTVVSLWR